ncbi:MAG: IMP dehydrogenase, partial [Bacteroidales bacterium]
MTKIIDEVSRTFNEYLIIPGLTTKKHTINNVNLKTPLVKFRKGQTPSISLNVPFVSSIMQSVSDSNMAIALAKEGGLSFIFGSQSIE